MAPGHIMIVPIDHVAAMNEADEEVQFEVKRFKQVRFTDEEERMYSDHCT